jgi:16S rRNA G966 N2-methylase RsmD
VISAKAAAFLKKGGEQFDIVFLDPPYSLEQEELLALVSGSGILKQESVVVAEHFKKQKSPEQAGRLSLYREAKYGDTVLAFYRTEGGVSSSQ